MYHHDSRSYNEAASAAAAVARRKLDDLIQNGIASARKTIENVQAQVIDDRLAKGSALTLVQREQGFALRAGDDNGTALHAHALGQVLDKAGIPVKVFHDIASRQSEGDPWGNPLARYLVNEVYRHDDRNRYLLRTVGTGEDARLLGFLSDRFRRIDSRPQLDAFVGAASKVGLVPLEGHNLATRNGLRVLLPKIFEPIPNEVFALGLQWSNSDFGDGGHTVSLFCFRMWCTNLAMGPEALRQVHLGRRLKEGITFTKETYDADSKANALALRDVVDDALSPARVEAYLNVIREANTKEVHGRDGAMLTLKKYLDQGTAERAVEHFTGPDVEHLPPGANLYRLSNAVSWLAQAQDFTTEQKLELQTVAGMILGKPAFDAVEV